MPRGATCSPISKATTIASGVTPPSATSPRSRQRQRQNPRNQVSTFQGEGQANLPVQNINLRYAGRILRCAAAFENARRSVQQLLLPGVDLVRVYPVRARQLGDGPVAPDRRQRHLGLERRTVLLACLLHVLLPRHRRFPRGRAPP